MERADRVGLLVLVGTIGCGVFWRPMAARAGALEPGREPASEPEVGGKAPPPSTPRVLRAGAQPTPGWIELERQMERLRELDAASPSTGALESLRDVVRRGVRDLSRRSCQPLGKHRLRRCARLALEWIAQRTSSTPFWVDLVLDHDLLTAGDEAKIQRLAGDMRRDHASAIARLLHRVWAQQIRDGRIRPVQRLASARLMLHDGSPAQRLAARLWLPRR